MDGNRVSSEQQQRLARVTFAGVMVALVVIFLVRNAERFEDFQTESRFSELIEIVEPIQDMIEADLLSGGAGGIELLDSGASGLPAEVFVSQEAHGVSVIDGRIIATWINDESDLDGVTYILTPKIKDGAVEWATTGTCGGKKAC